MQLVAFAGTCPPDADIYARHAVNVERMAACKRAFDHSNEP